MMIEDGDRLTFREFVYYTSTATAVFMQPTREGMKYSVMWLNDEGEREYEYFAVEKDEEGKVYFVREEVDDGSG